MFSCLFNFLQLSVSEFIWGYEDELACLDSNPGESEYYDEEYNDPFSAFEDFEESKSDDEDKLESRSSTKPNFRRPDGKCVLGALVERNGKWEPPIKMLTGNTGLQDKGRILEISGSSNFNVWNKNSFCDKVSGSTKTRKKVHFGRTMHCLPQRLKSIFF